MQGDCLEEMKAIPDGSIDMILTDPPYGTTACKWDSVIPLDHMWVQLNQVSKKNAAIALFGTEPFSSKLRLSNIARYKYDWVWNKKQKSNFLNARKQPLRVTERVSMFYGMQCTYRPVTTSGHAKKQAINIPRAQSPLYGKQTGKVNYSSTDRYPSDILIFSKDTQKLAVHPTQKPVALMEYLIKTYTNKGETVLDFTMGSGSTGVACGNLDRRFIGIELDEEYFQIAQDRIAAAYAGGLLD